ncbi:50S ribosomal protein L7/L12 [Nocardiopsis sp. NPDC007018]|uniref:50S ribosomal protein L7/L12 n=1 Tax=Nocardiopsis sp. NPDC007018 TaxID=3155721 RepID=UPI0033FF4194
MPAALNRAEYEEILHLTLTNRKVQAIMRIRELTGLGLVRARKLAEAIETGRWTPVPDPGRGFADLVRELLEREDEESRMAEDEARCTGSLDQP